MDVWILAALQSLVQFVIQEMEGVQFFFFFSNVNQAFIGTRNSNPHKLAYRLYTVVPKLLQFIDELTNWYVRFNRKRLKVRFPLGL